MLFNNKYYQTILLNNNNKKKDIQGSVYPFTVFVSLIQRGNGRKFHDQTKGVCLY